MLKMNTIGENRNYKVGLLLRITEKKLEDGTLIAPIDIMNKYVDFLEKNQSVWFSHSQYRECEISKLIAFTWKNNEWFAVELEYDDYRSSNMPFIPEGITADNTPIEWAEEPMQVWAHVTGFKVLSMADLNKLISVRTKTPLSDKIKERAFRAALFEI